MLSQVLLYGQHSKLSIYIRGDYYKLLEGAVDVEPNLENSVTSKESLYPLKEGSYTVQLRENLALKVYADSRPHNLKIAQLQKGLVLILNGRELIEEGAGFGVPVAIYSDKTYFSSSAQVSVAYDRQGKTIMKRFFMDSTSRRSWKIGAFINNPLYKGVSSFLESVYRDHSPFQRAILPLMKLKNKVGVKTSFAKAEPRGEVTMAYDIKQDGIDIKADLTKLSKNSLKKIVLLNEQGATFFRRFLDSNGSALVNDKIGAWNIVKADWASLSAYDNSLSFCLRRLPDCKLFIGRESVKGSLAWVGMEYEINPRLDLFNYEVQVRLRRRDSDD